MKPHIHNVCAHACEHSATQAVHYNSYNMSFWGCRAKASCTSQIATAKAVAAEFGETAASECGVLDWARVPLSHSEEKVHKVCKEQRTTLDLPITEFRAGPHMIPWLSPQDWLQFIVDHGCWHALAGLKDDQRHLAEPRWEHFWAEYRKLRPNFAPFLEERENMDWSRTVGLLLHGDEGRTLKRGGLLVTSIQSILGCGFDEKRTKRSTDPTKLHVNYSGHVYTTRFVTSVIPKTLYESGNGDIFYEAMTVLARALNGLLEFGVTCKTTGVCYRAVVLGCNGDLPYLQKAGRLTRAFNTGVKRGRENARPRGICHLCLAGTGEHHYEELSGVRPSWLVTMGVKLPWVEPPPFIAELPHDLADPASFFMYDVWHTVHLGFGRSTVASCLQLMLDYLPCSNLDERWSFLTDHYRRWCRSEHRQPHITKITGYLMSYGDKTGAMGNWHKGALTTNFLKWLPSLIREFAHQSEEMNKCLLAVCSMNAFFSFLYESPLFLDRTESLFAAKKVLDFLRMYQELAVRQWQKSLPHLFPLYPKLHVFHHIGLQLLHDSSACGFACNPISVATQVDEDLIGRTARVSRRVSIRTVMDRTLQRYLISCKASWIKAGLLR